MKPEHFLQTLGSVGVIVWLLGAVAEQATLASYGLSLAGAALLGLLALIASRLPT